MIETIGLTKRYGDLVAVKSIDLTVKDGEIFGLLGPNGAGKTTTISMLATMLAPTSGEAKVAGKDVMGDPNGVRQSIGIVFQDPSLDDDLTGYENLEFHARLYHMQKEERVRRIPEVLGLVDLMDKKDVQVKNYSGGMKRRLEIARGLMHRPKMLFLDEPTLGLDPQTRRHLWEYIRKMNEKEGVTILITTHYMEEADVLCDRVAIIDHGEIIALDTPAKLKSKAGKNVIMTEVSDAEKFCRLMKGHKSVLKATSVGGTVHLTVKDGEKLIPTLVSEAQKHGIDVFSVSLHSSTLEDVFIELTGRHIREEHGDAMGAFRQRVMARGRR